MAPVFVPSLAVRLGPTVAEDEEEEERGRLPSTTVRRRRRSGGHLSRGEIHTRELNGLLFLRCRGGGRQAF